jgi:RNA polymerase sigma-70 factor (ECF subfamily)
VTSTFDEETLIIRRAQAGDQRAFGWLVQRYQSPVYNLCYRMLGTPDEAQDAAQETFLRAYSKLKTFEDGRKFSSWLLSIGSHHCIDVLRRRRFAWVDIDEMAGVLPDRHEEQPEAAALRTESEAMIQRLLKTLPPDYRTVVVLYYWHQLSYEEIGQMLNISEPAIKSRLHRARKALAEKLAARPGPERRLEPAHAVQA